MANIKIKTIIMGAAGRDFHNFNTRFRDDGRYQVMAFTAAQIPDIEGRRYPPELSGALYPDGIPILAEEELSGLIAKHDVQQVVFSYSDVSHHYVMGKASQVIAWGADFVLLGAQLTMLKSSKPVIAIGAVRTGCGKSQTTRKVCELLKEMGRSAVVVRHPMPYGDLAKQKVQRFASYEDLDRHHCTVEEREEYEPHIDRGNVVYAGVDYGLILQEAEKEADIVVWDGGNNDLPFYRPDLFIVLVDPLRPGHELGYYPGHTCLRMADVVLVNKENTASLEGIETVKNNARSVNPTAVIVDAASPLTVENPQIISGKRVLVVEDGPTLTHGGMEYGAGTVAAREFGAAEIIDPRPYLKGTLKETFRKYPGIGRLLPAMGYGRQQVADLERTIAAVPCDAVILGTPIDLTRVVKIGQPSVRVRYELQEIGQPDLRQILTGFLDKQRSNTDRGKQKMRGRG
jgi:predicted GTPase